MQASRKVCCALCSTMKWHSQVYSRSILHAMRTLALHYCKAEHDKEAAPYRQDREKADSSLLWRNL